MSDKQNESKTLETITSQMKELVSVKEGFSKDQLTFIRNLVNKDLTDNELYMFLVFSGKLGLNPFTQEIVAVVYKKNDPNLRRVNYIVTRNGKRRKAADFGGAESVQTEAIYIKEYSVDTGRKNPKGEAIYEKQTVRVKSWEGGSLWGAKCTIVRNNNTYIVEAPLSEYTTREYIWAQKPSTMIKKVAESQALSEAFPELLGVYDESEMSAGSIQSKPNVPQVEDGGAVLKKDDPMLKTLGVLGADIATRDWSRQEAVEEIARLNAEKGKGKAKS